MSHGKTQVTISHLKKNHRIGLAFVGALVLCFGLGSLSRGGLLYANWWGGVVFAPFAVILGLIALGIAIYGRYASVK
jgi:hypothetical protein